MDYVLHCLSPCSAPLFGLLQNIAVRVRLQKYQRLDEITISQQSGLLRMQLCNQRVYCRILYYLLCKMLSKHIFMFLPVYFMAMHRQRMSVQNCMFCKLIRQRMPRLHYCHLSGISVCTYFMTLFPLSSGIFMP